MNTVLVAQQVFKAMGGHANILSHETCMTRLRVVIDNPQAVDTDILSVIPGILGYVRKGSDRIDIVFGPGKVEAVYQALQTILENNESSLYLDEDEHVSSSEEEVADELEDLESLLQTYTPQNISLSSPLDAMNIPRDAPENIERRSHAKRVLVINGPNINMLGMREPDIYGKDSYQTLLKTCHDSAREAGFAHCSCFQSNHEGDLVDAIQDALNQYDGIVINPGAYTHTSIAILDAARAVGLPMIEVHISNIAEREEFRQISYIRAACIDTVLGKGIQGYRIALFKLAEHLEIASQE